MTPTQHVVLALVGKVILVSEGRPEAPVGTTLADRESCPGRLVRVIVELLCDPPSVHCTPGVRIAQSPDLERADRRPPLGRDRRIGQLGKIPNGIEVSTLSAAWRRPFRFGVLDAETDLQPLSGEPGGSQDRPRI